MNAPFPVVSVKQIGANGQISLGKQYAGRQVMVEEQAPGVWLIRTATVVPDNQAWLQMPGEMEKLQRALAWAAANPPRDDNTDEILARLAAAP